MLMNRAKRGFTLIEVVLVLAIAGLIFLMVFVALPALMKSQRDAQRRQNVGEIIAAMELYRKNNNGLYPGTMISGRKRGQPCFNMSGSGCNTLKMWNDFLERYANEYEDPSSGKKYHVAASSNYGSGCREQAGKFKNFRNMNYTPLVICYSTICDDNYSNAKDYGTIAVLYEAERGGIICMNNR